MRTQIKQQNGLIEGALVVFFENTEVVNSTSGRVEDQFFAKVTTSGAESSAVLAKATKLGGSLQAVELC